MKRWKKTQCYCFAIEPIALFKNESRFPFLEMQSHSKFIALQKKYIVLIINKYILSKTIFYLNNKKLIIEKIAICRKINDAQKKFKA